MKGSGLHLEMHKKLWYLHLPLPIANDDGSARGMQTNFVPPMQRG